MDEGRSGFCRDPRKPVVRFVGCAVRTAHNRIKGGAHSAPF